VTHQPTAYMGGVMVPRGIVNHIAQGYKRTIDEDMKKASPGYSCHFAIDRAGNITQYVPIDRVAWHASRRDVGNPPTWKHYNGSDPGQQTVGIEHEGFSIDPIQYGYDYLYSQSRPWPKAMVDATIRVQKWVCETANITPSVDTIIGHNLLNPSTRAHDPGAAWPRIAIIAGCAKEPPKEKPMSLNADQQRVVNQIRATPGLTPDDIKYLLGNVGLTEMPTGTTTPPPTTSAPTAAQIATAIRLLKESESRTEAALKLLGA